jgi:hypothetical protein
MLVFDPFDSKRVSDPYRVWKKSAHHRSGCSSYKDKRLTLIDSLLWHRSCHQTEYVNVVGNMIRRTPLKRNTYVAWHSPTEYIILITILILLH